MIGTAQTSGAAIKRKPLGSVVARHVRQFVRERKWGPEYRRLEKARGIGEGRRAFLLGNGPSLAAIDLSRLDDEFVCVVNMGIRAVGDRLSHADMHIVTDTNRYRRFAAEIEAHVLRHPVPHRFISNRMRGIWRSLPERANEPIYILPHTAKLTDKGALPLMAEGVVTGPSVLITGAALLEFLGFDSVYVIGCDLDYESGGKYFYRMGELDLAHEGDPGVMARRPGIDSVAQHFAALHRVFAARGRAIANAGIGGNLDSLPRVPFDSLF